jgi:hypothetical protein
MTMRTPNIEALKKDFPDGYRMSAVTRLTYKLSPTIRTSGIECAEFIRLITGWVGPGGKWKTLSPVENKKELCEPFRIPQSGDTFVSEGGKWGHIGIVLRVYERSDKTWDLDIVDANSRLDGVIRYRRINSSKCYGFANLGLKDKYATVTEQHYKPMNNPIPFQSQYSYDICVPMSCIKALQHALGGKAKFSVPQLYAEMALEGLNINSSGKVLQYMQDKGVIAEQYNQLLPSDQNAHKTWKEKAIKNTTKKRHKISSFSLLAGRATPETKSIMKNALIKGNVLVITTDATIANWDRGAKHKGKFYTNHSVLVTGFNERDEWIIANHWEGRETGVLHPDYPMSWIYQVNK